MLVLNRKLNERIFIGDEIAVSVMRIGVGQVRLGIEAPQHVKIQREEVSPIDHPLRSVKPIAAA